MISQRGWKKIFLMVLFVTPFLFLTAQVPTPAFGAFWPYWIVDVTTKAFSVVWTTGSSYTSQPTITLYEDAAYSIPITLEAGQVVVETDAGRSGEAGKQYGVAMVTVQGLDIDTPYYFRVQHEGKTLNDGSVRTEKLKGLTSHDPGDTDIVSNDVVHKIVLIDPEELPAQGESPAIGVIVLAEIYEHDDSDTPISDFPISAWVGDGMPGDDSSNPYDANHISYEQYAALNMNNLFGSDSSIDPHFPLSLHGDDLTTTTINEAEIIKFTIVHGTLPVLNDDDNEYFNSYGRIQNIEKVNGEPITTPTVSASFRFKTGLNNFALPFELTLKDENEQPIIYETKDLWEELEALGGTVNAIWTFKGGEFVPTSKWFGQIVDSEPIVLGKGCFVDMQVGLTDDVFFYGKPNSVSVNLNQAGLNLISVPQLPAYYETKDLWKDIEENTGSDTVLSIWSYTKDGWEPTSKWFGQIVDSVKMINNQFYFVELKTGATIVENWDPFAGD